MNRFTSDLGALDENLIITLYETIEIILRSAFVFLLIIILKPVMVLPTVAVLAILFLLRQHYIPTNRAIRRIDSISKDLTIYLEI
jgi:hypothetical protein